MFFFFFFFFLKRKEGRASGEAAEGKDRVRVGGRGYGVREKEAPARRDASSSAFEHSLASALLLRTHIPFLKLTVLSRQKTLDNLVGARSAERSRPCAGALRATELAAIDAGAEISARSRAHEDHALLLLAAAAPAGAS